MLDLNKSTAVHHFYLKYSATDLVQVYTRQPWYPNMLIVAQAMNVNEILRL